MTIRTFSLGLIAALAACVALAPALSWSSSRKEMIDAGAARVSSQLQNAVTRARQLAQAPDVIVDTSSAMVHSRLLPNREAVLEYASQRAMEIPLAPGASFDNIQWRAIGLVAPEQVQGFLEYDAACSWYRYLWNADQGGASAGVLAALGRIVDAIPQWPTFRVNERGVRAQAVATAVAGGDHSYLQAEVSGDCSS